jgi:hypothetical protein
MSAQLAKAVPAVSLAALDAIQDPQTRTVLRALVDGTHVRNGDVGNGDNRFITAKELTATTGRINTAIAAVASAIPTLQQFPDVAKIVADAVAEVIESPLFRDLGQRVTLIDAPTGLVESIKKDLLEAATKVMKELGDAVDQLPEGVTDLSDIFDTSIKQTKGIKKTLYDPTGALPLAQAAIVALNTIDVSSTSASAKTVAGLQATVYDKGTGLAAATAAIGEINKVDVSSTSAAAQKLASMIATVNDKNTGLAAATAAITEINNVSADSKSAAAQKLAGLTAQLIDPKTGKPFSEAMIAESSKIAVDNATAIANYAHVTYASLGTQQNRTYVGAKPPEAKAAVAGSAFVPATSTTPAKPAVAPQPAVPQVGDIWYDTSNNNRAKRYDGTNWVDYSDTRIGLVEGGIVDERDVRLSQDKALVNAIKTVWGAVGGNSGLIQFNDKVEVNTAGAVATSFNQVQAAVKDASGNIIYSSAVKQTAEATATRTGQIESKWTVNLDSGGAATGFRQAGFGISGSATESGIKYAFGVRADSFWIASPNQTVKEGDTIPSAQVPFIVKTASWKDSQGVTQPPGTYLNELFATSAKIGIATITTAHIKDANVTTLKIAGNSVMVGTYDEGGGVQVGGTVTLLSRTINLGDNFSSGLIVNGCISLTSSDNNSAGFRFRINGVVVGDQRVGLQGGWTYLVPATGFGGAGTGTVTVTLEAYINEKPYYIYSSAMSIIGGKR